MRVYLSSLSLSDGGKNVSVFAKNNPDRKIYMLESFALTSKSNLKKVIPYSKDLMLDSGAFTFLKNGVKGPIDWDEFIELYAKTINEFQIEHFFELDIDKIVGYENVKKLRHDLEMLTQKTPIPVWHKSRGIQEFVKMTKRYPYVAIGGIVSNEFKKSEHRFFPWFIETAHKNGAKIHGLGIGNSEEMKKYHFDSVDTSNPCYFRYGIRYDFQSGNMYSTSKPLGYRYSGSELAVHNIEQYSKFSEYAEINL